MNTKRIKISIIALILIIMVIFSVIAGVNFKNAPEKAENILAVYMHKEYNKKYYYYPEFHSFKKIYSTVNLEKGSYIVELSGSCNSGEYGKSEDTFYSKIKISPFSNNAKIEKLTFDNRKIIK